MANMNKFFSIFVFVFCYVALHGCSFRPVYSQQLAVDMKELRKIYVEPIDSILGSEYYEAIYDLLQPIEPTDYILITTLNHKKEIAVLEQSSDVLRERIVAIANYKLIRRTDGKEINGGSVKLTLSYSTTFEPYSNELRSSDSSSKLSRAVAEEIRNRLILFFANRPDKRNRPLRKLVSGSEVLETRI